MCVIAKPAAKLSRVASNVHCPMCDKPVCLTGTRLHCPACEATCRHRVDEDSVVIPRWMFVNSTIRFQSRPR